MHCLTVLLFCGTLFILAITLADGEIIRIKLNKNRKMQKNAQGTTKNKELYKATTKIKNLYKTTTKQPPTSPMKKKTTVKTYKAASVLTTPVDEFAPDIELGTNCYDACYPNSTFLDGSGKILNPKQYGVFTDEYCGKTYLFGTKQVTWDENWKTCCAIGMMPVIFDTQDELFCIQKAVQGGKIHGNQHKVYWTGGFRHELQSTWNWCTKDSPESIEEAVIGDMATGTTPGRRSGDIRRTKTADEDYNCLASNYDVSKLNNYACENNKTFLSCESVEKYVSDLLPGKGCKANCNAKSSCSKNKTLFMLNEKQELKLMERYKYGRWVSRCGRYFLFSNKTATYAEAREKCCSYGTNLLSIKTAAKRRCLSKLAKDYPDVVGEYWTSGSDKGCDSNFRWCSVDRAFLKKEVLWGRKEPKLSKGDCVGTRIKDIHKDSTLFTGNCTTKRKFICEVRQSGTTVEAVQKECVDLLRLTPGEVDGLNNTGNYTYKMKCYLRCIGDNLGMLINGTLQEGNVMKLMEKSNEQGDTDKGYEAIDACKLMKNDTDDCQSAYQMYKCGKEKAPVVFGKMVVYEEVTSGEEKAPVDVLEHRRCDVEASAPWKDCKDQAKEFKNITTIPDGGEAIIGWNGKRWYKSKFNTSYNYEYASKYCDCLESMRLPTFDTLQEFKLLFNFMNGSTQDNFYSETFSSAEGEKWCKTQGKLPAEVSVDNFTLLPEKSLLYSKKEYTPEYKLISIRKSQLETHVQVNYFYCEPFDD